MLADAKPTASMEAHVCFSTGHANNHAIAQLLRDRGADPHAGVSLLHASCEFHFEFLTDGLRWLISHGADPNHGVPRGLRPADVARHSWTPGGGETRGAAIPERVAAGFVVSSGVADYGGIEDVEFGFLRLRLPGCALERIDAIVHQNADGFVIPFLLWCRDFVLHHAMRGRGAMSAKLRTFVVENVPEFAQQLPR